MHMIMRSSVVSTYMLLCYFKRLESSDGVLDVENGPAWYRYSRRISDPQ